MTATASTPKTETKTPLWMAVEANELGHVTGLEPHAQYFVVRKPTQQLTKERSQQFTEDVKAFLHEQRVLAERQMKELNEKYGEPAKARVSEVRSTLEKRFDELAKEIEQRIGKIEHELGERGILKTRKDDKAATTPPATGPGHETPGEMPMGTSDLQPSTPSTPKKKTATK